MARPDFALAGAPRVKLVDKPGQLFKAGAHETGTSTNMTRLRGRCPRGKRLVAKVPHGHGKMTTFVAGLRQGGTTAPFVVDAPMNGEIFLSYLEQCLVPTLSLGEIVSMDNLHGRMPHHGGTNAGVRQERGEVLMCEQAWQ